MIAETSRRGGAGVVDPIEPDARRTRQALARVSTIGGVALAIFDFDPPLTDRTSAFRRGAADRRALPSLVRPAAVGLPR
ncbi:hypothetical protein [Dactylosporangium sp. CA-092794]|uniref:hypothetical protein n=1 Tax=Dactylosporangium sp. CA-092794 TaxID=3239929 RepID=UPI003D8A7833